MTQEEWGELSFEMIEAARVIGLPSSQVGEWCFRGCAACWAFLTERGKTLEFRASPRSPAQKNFFWVEKGGGTLKVNMEFPCGEQINHQCWWLVCSLQGSKKAR